MSRHSLVLESELAAVAVDDGKDARLLVQRTVPLRAAN